MLNLAEKNPPVRSDELPKAGHSLHPSDAEATHVSVPDSVDVPLPREPIEQIAVPASINGRDLSRGKP